MANPQPSCPTAMQTDPVASTAVAAATTIGALLAPCNVTNAVVQATVGVVVFKGISEIGRFISWLWSKIGDYYNTYYRGIRVQVEAERTQIACIDEEMRRLELYKSNRLITVSTRGQEIVSMIDVGNYKLDQKVEIKTNQGVIEYKFLKEGDPMDVQAEHRLIRIYITVTKTDYQLNVYYNAVQDHENF